MKQQARSIMHLIVAETFPKLFFVAFNSPEFTSNYVHYKPMNAGSTEFIKVIRNRGFIPNCKVVYIIYTPYFRSHLKWLLFTP